MQYTPSLLFRRAVKEHWPMYALGCVTMLITSTSEVLVPKFVQWGLDFLAAQGQMSILPPFLRAPDPQSSLNRLVVFLLVVLLVGFLGRIGWRQTFGRRTHDAGYELKNQFWNSLRFQPMFFFHRYPLGDLMNRAIGDWNKVRFIHGFTLVTTFDVIYFVILAVASMLWINVPLTLLCLAMVLAAVSAFFSGIGNTKTLIWINCAGLLANVVFDYLMIFGNFGFPAWGIFGAGIATALANVAAALLGCYLIFSKNNEKLYRLRTGWAFSLDLMKRYIKYGVPSGMQWALEGLAFTVFLVVVGRMPNGSAALSSSGIVVTIMMLAVLPAMGVAQAASIMVGQHLGEKQPAKAEATTWSGLQVASIYIFTMGLTFALFPEFYLGWFHNPNDLLLWNQVSTIVPYLLLFVALFTTFDSMNLVFSFALKGAGDTRFVTLVALLMPWPLMVLPTWLLKDYEGAVYWAWGAASVFIISQAMVFLWRFLGGKWKEMSVIN